MVGDLVEEDGMVAEVDVVGAELSTLNGGVVDRDFHESSNLIQFVECTSGSSCFFAKTMVVRTCFMVWLVLSALPFICGWNGDYIRVLISMRRHTACQNALVNLVPMSYTTLV